MTAETVPECVAPEAAAPPSWFANLRFLEEVSAATAGVSRLEMCIQCGTCGGSCPSAADMDHTPRLLFAMVRAGMREQVLQSNTPWVCVSCYHCVVRCPQNVHIADVMYTLKSMAIRERRFKDATPPHFSQTFVELVENYGRAFEFGLASHHYLERYPLRLPALVPLAVGMLSKGRMQIGPNHIKGIKQLQAILARAKELEVSS